MQLYDIVRSLVTNALLVTLLFTLAQPKCQKRTLWLIFSTIVVIDFGINAFFYLKGDYTTLAVLDMVFFILVGAVTKPLFRETLMQWLFNCFTAMNIYVVAVLVSYYLCGFFQYPYYALTALRAVIFVAAILLLHKRLRPLYRQATEHWSVYLFVSVGLFTNFAWYFVSGGDVEQAMRTNVVPLLLLVGLGLLVYLSMFLSLRKNLREAALREENLKIQSWWKFQKACEVRKALALAKTIQGSLPFKKIYHRLLWQRKTTQTP